MKPTSIQIGKIYEITFGKNTTKVKVKNFDPKNGSWICETESGKSMPIKDAKRFLTEIKPKESKEPEKSKEPKIPKQKTPDESVKSRNKAIQPETLPKKPLPPKVTGDAAAQLLAKVRTAAIRASIARKAFEYGFCSEKIARDAETLAETARTDLRTAGITERKGGHTLGAMSGLDAAYKVLQEERRPMRAKEITRLAQEKGYCELRGRTPDATIAAAIETEIKRKGKDSRFTKVDKGLFTVMES